MYRLVTTLDNGTPVITLLGMPYLSPSSPAKSHNLVGITLIIIVFIVTNPLEYSYLCET